MPDLPSARALYRDAAAKLRSAGIDNAAQEADWLARRFLSCQKADLTDDRCVPDAHSAAAYRAAVKRRAAGEPLQYLLGDADFLGLRIAVGRGVLIPRPETELLCTTGAEFARRISRPVVWDLCAGSGCVSLGLASLVPGARVFAVEKYAAALDWLARNAAAYPQYEVTLYRADVLRSRLTRLPDPDLILSNPPYIEAGALDSLQREVRKEPRSALDGGADGLTFYRRLARLGAQRLKPGGCLAVEVGAGQAKTAAALFTEANLRGAACLPDEAGIERIVTCFRADGPFR